MKHIYGFVLFAWLTANLISDGSGWIMHIAPLLGALCFFIVKARFLDRTYMSLAFLAASAAGAYLFHPAFALLLGVPLTDFTYSKKYHLALPVFGLSAYAAIAGRDYELVLIMFSAALTGFITGVKDENEKRNLQVLDDERRLRYKLEQTQNELIVSRREIENLTETRERNRIAHEIHDSVGHSIAGVIFQLDAALRNLQKDSVKAEEILKLCRNKLAEALELTRDTVFNLRAGRKTGIDSLEKILEDFNYCPVVFEHTGDINSISATSFQILEANLKELLTNASKHSKASEIRIRIDVNSRNVRLYYRDNGKGCENICEHTGLAGMRDRVRNAGGAFSADGRDGFLVVCNLPAGPAGKTEFVEEYI